MEVSGWEEIIFLRESAGIGGRSDGVLVGGDLVFMWMWGNQNYVWRQPHSKAWKFTCTMDCSLIILGMPILVLIKVTTKSQEKHGLQHFQYSKKRPLNHFDNVLPL